MPQRRFAFFFGIVLALFCAGCQHSPPEGPTPASISVAIEEESLFELLDTGLAKLVEERGMIGMSAGVVRQGKLAWSRGYGYADLENQVQSAPDTLYRIGTCSQAIAATVIVKLVEEGVVDLDDRMTDYRLHSWYPDADRGAHVFPEGAQVRHVLSNTAQGTPGQTYRYTPSLFADLTWVVEEGSGLPYPRALEEYIFEPGRLEHTVPGQLAPGYDTELAQLAKPYDVRNENPLLSAYRVIGLKRLFEGLHDEPIDLVELDPALEEARREVLGAAYTPLYGVNASGGIISSVSDLARFDAALDAGSIVSDAGRTTMWTAAGSPSGEALPQGLGWFVQDYHGARVVWQFGETSPSVSALYVKVPEAGITFIALANTDRLCAGYDLAAGDVTASPFARLFLETVTGEPETDGSTTPGRTRTGSRR
jgi:CubicO group peptidase (beta-lactamase class C family)